MIKEESLELARACVRTCHVLIAVTKGRDANGLSDASEKQIEDLGRCVKPVQPSPPTVTSDIRIVRHIESVVNERANCGRNLRGSHLESTEECLIALRSEMLEILRVLDVRGFQLTAPPVSELLQRDLVGLGAGAEHVQRSVGPEPRDSVIVRDRLSLPRNPLLTICPPSFDVDYVTVIPQ